MRKGNIIGNILFTAHRQGDEGDFSDKPVLETIAKSSFFRSSRGMADCSPGEQENTWPTYGVPCSAPERITADVNRVVM